MYMANVSFRYIYLSNKERWNKEYIFWKVFRVRPNASTRFILTKPSPLADLYAFCIQYSSFTWLRFCIFKFNDIPTICSSIRCTLYCLLLSKYNFSIFNRHMLILDLYLVRYVLDSIVHQVIFRTDWSNDISANQ